MTKHEERMRRAVDDLRALRSPSDQARVDMLAALERRLGGPPGDGGASGGGSSGGGDPAITLGWAAKVAGATIAATAGGLLLLRVGVLAVRAIGGDDGSPREREAAVIEEREPREERPVPTVSKPEAATGLPPIETTGGQPSRIEPREARGDSKALPQPVPSAVPTDHLAAELALLRAAKAISSPSARLEQLAQLAEQFPDGALASEREALVVVALCELDRIDEARVRARALADERGGSPLIERIREGCPLLADELATDSN